MTLFRAAFLWVRGAVVMWLLTVVLVMVGGGISMVVASFDHIDGERNAHGIDWLQDAVYGEEPPTDLSTPCELWGPSTLQPNGGYARLDSEGAFVAC